LLHWAALAGQSELVAMLIDKGAGLENVDRRNRTPLMWALHGAWLGHLQGDWVGVVRRLLAAGADANPVGAFPSPDPEYRSPTLHMAEAHGMEEIVELLVEYGARA